MKPTPRKPKIIIAQVEGSGTAAIKVPVPKVSAPVLATINPKGVVGSVVPPSAIPSKTLNVPAAVVKATPKRSNARVAVGNNTLSQVNAPLLEFGWFGLAN